MKQSIIITLVLACGLFISGFSFAQIAIPNIQGTWQVSISGKDINWTGQAEGIKDKGNLFIYQREYDSPILPNLTVVFEDAPTDSFQGFIQGNQFSFYKNNPYDGASLKREIVIGKLSKKGNALTGKGMAFDSNPKGGSTCSYNFRAKLISGSVPEPPPPPPAPPGQTFYIMDCPRCENADIGECGEDPFDESHANYILVISGVVGSIAAIGVELTGTGTPAHIELRDESSGYVLAESEYASTSNVGWTEFVFSPAFTINRPSVVLNFVADGNARVLNWAVNGSFCALSG